MSEGLTPDELECIRSVKRAADELGLAIVAVGASARQLVFDWPHGIRIHRTTTDWDFGVRVADWKTFERLKGKLVEEAFAQGGSEQRLIHLRTGVRIDLVPFGGLESDHHIRWPGSLSEMNVFGFSEAFDTAATVRLGPGLDLPVATIPLLIALKIM